MKKFVLAAMLLVLVSCKGTKGEKGDTGNANVQSYSGFVTGADQNIFVSGGPTDYAVAVSIGDGTHFTNLPFFRTGAGVNATYAFSLNNVDLLNCDTAPGNQYRIFLIQKTGGFSSQRLES